MNSEELKTFIFLSKVKNFTLAAEQLFIAQSTVTNRINELEKEVYQCSSRIRHTPKDVHRKDRKVSYNLLRRQAPSSP